MSSLKVWSRFTAKKRDGTELKFRIQDLPSDRLEDALILNLKYFVPDENIHKCAGIYKSEEAIAEGHQILLGLMHQPTYHATICCLDDDTETVGEIIGLSGISLQSKKDANHLDELENQLQTKELRKFFEIVNGTNAMNDVFKMFEVEKYYDGRGIAVNPDYRGLGIATEFLKTRRMICLETGVSLTGAWMSAFGTQKAAEREDWQTSFEISYDEIAQRYGVSFDNNAPTYYKWMYTEVKL